MILPNIKITSPVLNLTEYNTYDKNKMRFSVHYKNDYHTLKLVMTDGSYFSHSKFHRTKSFELFTCLTK